MFIIQLKRTLRSIYFIALAWRTILILRNKGFHEFVLTLLPRFVFTTLMDLSYSAFVSKLLISSDSLISRSCMYDNFASVLGCSQLNRTWKSFECSVQPDASHFPVILSWCSSYNLISKHQGNCLVIVYFCYRIVYFSVLQLV